MSSFLEMKKKMQGEFVAPPAPSIDLNWTSQDRIAKLSRIDSEFGPRVYTDESNRRFISVTSLLSEMEKFNKIEFLAGWTAYMGESAAKSATNKGAARGTVVHSCLEKWIKRESFAEEIQGNRLYQKLFNQAASSIQRNVYSFIAAELQVKSSNGFAGTADAVGYVKFPSGRISRSIIDFKNYIRPKERHDMLQAFYQVALYSYAVQESAGIYTDSALIIATNESGEKAEEYFLEKEEFKEIKREALAEAIKVIRRLENAPIS